MEKLPKIEEVLPLLRAAQGLNLGQVCAITGLESYTVQNWIKRGFVPHPVGKRYFERHISRILMISAMRDALQIENIGELMAYVNGDTDDEGDDLLSETELYGYFRRCAEAEDPQKAVETETEELAKKDGHAARSLRRALYIMVCAYKSAQFKKEAERAFCNLKEE